MEMNFFYDSYAIIEYLEDNPHVITYFEENEGVLTILNILEVYYSSLQEIGKEKADIVLEKLWLLQVPISKEVIKKAMDFRLKNKKQNLSYADCIGYSTAQERGIKFLTADNQFKQFDGVEFVK